MKKTGIWLDRKKALLVNLEGLNENLLTIKSEVEDYRISGGSGTRFKGGPQDVVQDSKYLERRKHQLKNYFKNIASNLLKSHEIVLFGPADTNEKFYKFLQTRHNSIGQKVKDVIKADSMTSNQVVALIKNYFDIH